MNPTSDEGTSSHNNPRSSGHHTSFYARRHGHLSIYVLSIKQDVTANIPLANSQLTCISTDNCQPKKNYPQNSTPCFFLLENLRYHSFFWYELFPLWPRAIWYKNDGKNNKFEYDFLMICTYLNLERNQRIISLNIEWKKTILSTLKGNNSCKM
jgi:hypothetical protein